MPCLHAEMSTSIKIVSEILQSDEVQARVGGSVQEAFQRNKVRWGQGADMMFLLLRGSELMFHFSEDGTLSLLKSDVQGNGSMGKVPAAEAQRREFRSKVPT